MTRTLLLALAAATLVVAGCGQQPRPESPPVAGTPRLTGCTAGQSAPSMQGARPIRAAVDLDHDGVGDAVKVTRIDSRCPGVLFAEVRGHVLSIPLQDTALDPTSGTRVIVPGRQGDLLAVREVHPRGGYQVHLYGYDGKSFGEVTSGGKPVLPFVATDTRGDFLSVSCAEKSLVLRQAVAHKPPGIVFAWDIQQTSYGLSGLTATSGGTTETADNVLDRQLGSRFPEVKRGELFATGCAG